MSRTKCWITILSVLALGTNVVRAQERDALPQAKKQESQERKNTQPRKKQRPERKGLSPAQVLVQRFERTAPQIGDLVPDVAGFDSDGKELKLRNLKGHYTVLTFGCLT